MTKVWLYATTLFQTNLEGPPPISEIGCLHRDPVRDPLACLGHIGEGFSSFGASSRFKG